MTTHTNNAPGSAGQNGAHTPGPWRKCGGATPAYIAVHSARGYIVFGMADSDVHTEGLNRKPIKAPDMWEQQANARLIAAAPDMYDALRAIDAGWTETFPDGPEGSREWLGGIGTLSDETVAPWRLIRAALAKAEGRADA